MGFKPAAYFIQRIAPGRRDDGVRMGLTFRKEEAEEFVDDIHTLKVLYQKDLEAPVAYWIREWSGERDPNGGRFYHSNRVEADLEVINGQKSQFTKDLRQLSKKGPVETAPGQWTEVIPLIPEF